MCVCVAKASCNSGWSPTYYAAEEGLEVLTLESPPELLRLQLCTTTPGLWGPGDQDQLYAR